MKAYAIVWGPQKNGVTLNLRSGNTCLAIFHEYSEAVKTLAGFADSSTTHRIIEVEISLA